MRFPFCSLPPFVLVALITLFPIPQRSFYSFIPFNVSLAFGIYSIDLLFSNPWISFSYFLFISWTSFSCHEFCSQFIIPFVFLLCKYNKRTNILRNIRKEKGIIFRNVSAKLYVCLKDLFDTWYTSTTRAHPIPKGVSRAHISRDPWTIDDARSFRGRFTNPRALLVPRITKWWITNWPMTTMKTNRNKYSFFFFFLSREQALVPRFNRQDK